VFPVLIHLGPFALHTYGVLVAAGYMAAISYVLGQQKRTPLTENQLWSLIYALFIGAIVGGKLAYAAASWSDGDGFWNAIRNFRYGFVFYGGFIGSTLCGLAYVWRHRWSPWKLADPFAGALPLGHAIGRLGCFAAGCCYGGPTDLPWGMRFTDPQALVTPGLIGVPLHPSQLYESMGNLLIFAFIHFRWLAKGKRPSFEGEAFLAYALLYAALRFAVEATRADDRGAFVLGLSPSQWGAILVAAVSAALWIRGRSRSRRGHAVPHTERVLG
jgi:phosphatidylglycerol:prolipoprotein diacylglycerol transferase